MLEDEIIQRLEVPLQDDVRQSWEMFYKHLHQLPKYQKTLNTRTLLL